MPRTAPLLRDLIDLHAALHADSRTDASERRRRDRLLGTSLAIPRTRPVRQLRGWLHRVRIEGWQARGAGAAQVYRLIGLGLWLLGLVAGWGVAQAVLHYTGAAPINIVNVLVVLILPQLLLLAFWLLAMLPWRLPAVSNLQSALRFLNPGRLASFLAAAFGGSGSGGLRSLWEPDHAVALAPAARWLFSLWSQLFALAFNVGALLAILYLVSFSDLAFGWSTTLTLDSARFHGLVNALSTPWQTLVPEAVPGAGLVEASRFYRLEGGVIGMGGVPTDVAELGAWWRFLVAALVCYGLIPRLLTLLVSWQRFGHHLRRGMSHLPGAAELLARMNSPLVSTAALQPEPQVNADTDGAVPGRANPVVRARCAVVAWSGSLDGAESLLRKLPELGIEPTEVFQAGGSRSTGEDAEMVAALCPDRDQGVAIVVKAWEPPLLEFVDFVQSVRARCQRRQPIVVLLRNADSGVRDSDAEVWRLTLRPLQDADLHIEAIP